MKPRITQMTRRFSSVVRKGKTMCLSLMVMMFLFLAGTSAANAQQKQKFSVVSFELDHFALTARSDQYKKVDGNGSLYAIIKVTSNTPDDDLNAYRFSFGNMNSLVERHEDELWVYVQRNAKMVTISRQGYATISRYDLQTTIEAGRTYVMQLSVSAAPVFTQMVQFAVEPKTLKAVVMIKSSNKETAEELFGNTDETGSVAKSLPYGSYTYRVMGENYHASEGRFTLSDKTKNHIEKVVLKPNFAEVTLQVDAAADIYVNGEKRGTRTWKGALKAGNYQVECRQTNHKPSSQVIVVEENNNRIYSLTKPTPITGTLAVTSQPIGATIRIDGKDYGVTPQNINDLLIGRHTVTLSRKNYKSESKTVDIKENDTTPLDMTLSDMAQMTITSRPSGSVLWIDGKQVGTTPYTAEMASGDYNIRVTHPKYRAYQKSVHLDSSNPHVTLSLDRQYQKHTTFYIQAGFQAGSLMGAEATLGCYINNFNIEGSFIYGLSRSEILYWNYTGSSYVHPVECSYTNMAYGGKLGYGIISGTSWRFTPQAGLNIVQLDGWDTFAYVSSVTVGCKADFAVTSFFGFFVAPELALAVSKSDTYKLLENVSSRIKGWGTGFNVRLGMSLTF